MGFPSQVILLANSPEAPGVGSGPFAGSPLCPILWPIARRRSFANRISDGTNFSSCSPSG